MDLPIIDPNAAREVQEELAVAETLSQIKYVIAVISNKGGVGKTTISVNLAYSLARHGFSVGILDADITGPNVPKMLGIEGQELVVDGGKVEPFNVYGVKAVSMSFLTENSGEAIMWRGPLKTSAIFQFLINMNWGDLDFLIVDLPPGTSDEALTIAQYMQDMTGVICVTTPQEVALLDLTKSVVFLDTSDIPRLGLIENMSGFTCPHCENKVNVFGSGSGKHFAKSHKMPFLGAIPLTSTIAKGGDKGRPFVSEDSVASLSFENVLYNLLNQLPEQEGIDLKDIRNAIKEKLDSAKESGALDQKEPEGFFQSLMSRIKGS